MKHQYFGDINDYRKYGLLRCLQAHSGLRVGVCWMLTPDDGRSDGKFISYLDKPASWRGHDPKLFDSLAGAVRSRRHLSHVEQAGILGNAVFFADVVPDARLNRQTFFAAASRSLSSADLIFYDPDNGIEVPSCPTGRKNSSKYLLKTEISETYASGKSVLLYQHFVREKRDAFIARLGAELRTLTGAQSISCFSTANVAFLLLPQPRHIEPLRVATAQVPRSWASQIRVSVDDVV
jgi:hypothetical protein